MEIFFIILNSFIYSFQEYYKKTYKIVGGSRQQELLQDNPDQESTKAFLGVIKEKVKHALFIKYNDLIKMFSENEKVALHSLVENKLISDQEYRLLKYKMELVIRNMDLDHNNWDEE